ncbi:MAG: transcriptional repressor [Oscillospiraceae bacterium]|nr:transcriptional repressor [Oscillospiraceae bacterium]
MGYMTSQRKALFDALEQHRDEALTAEQIIALMDKSASRSAVYRNLSALEKQGLVKKTVIGGANRVLYRYVGSKECQDHLHLECSKCGKTYHLKTPATNALIDDVMQDANFQIDSTNTVLYGVCGKCRKS